LIDVSLELIPPQAGNALVGDGQIVEQLQAEIDVVLEITGEIVDLTTERKDSLSSLRLPDPHGSRRGQDKANDGHCRHCQAKRGEARHGGFAPKRKSGKSEDAHATTTSPRESAH
jgi:hypothetical protein